MKENNMSMDKMKKEYDFSKGKRGRFYNPDAKLNIPLYLDHDIEIWCAKKAKDKGIDIQQLVNDLLRKDISLLS
jgi:hypothetical protein